MLRQYVQHVYIVAELHEPVVHVLIAHFAGAPIEQRDGILRRVSQSLKGLSAGACLIGPRHGCECQ